MDERGNDNNNMLHICEVNAFCVSEYPGAKSDIIWFWNNNPNPVNNNDIIINTLITREAYLSASIFPFVTWVSLYKGINRTKILESIATYKIDGTLLAIK